MCLSFEFDLINFTLGRVERPEAGRADPMDRPQGPLWCRVVVVVQGWSPAGGGGVGRGVGVLGLRYRSSATFPLGSCSSSSLRFCLRKKPIYVGVKTRGFIVALMEATLTVHRMGRVRVLDRFCVKKTRRQRLKLTNRKRSRGIHLGLYSTKREKRERSSGDALLCATC
ncbi:hypothetical protein EYF80_024894 [Liparis tanakae]|uniref:Uncharacterized protein n=1 Tax=Liparis tanakae TaxID=230148 RepID=A0A4Z2HGP6_9TELE|nr:hypothetical protein EYF80_024894 [Liparis tanakae]